MPSNRSSKASRASASQPVERHVAIDTEPRDDSPTNDLSAAQINSTDEAAGRPEQRKAIKQAMARQNIRLTQSPGAVGPIGRTVLLIALVALVALIAVWVVLAL